MRGSSAELLVDALGDERPKNSERLQIGSRAPGARARRLARRSTTMAAKASSGTHRRQARVFRSRLEDPTTPSEGSDASSAHRIRRQLGLAERTGLQRFLGPDEGRKQNQLLRIPRGDRGCEAPIKV